MIFSCFLVAALATLASAQISGTPPRDSCLCISGTSVNIRNSACGTTIATVSGGCYTYLNNNIDCILSGTPYTFYQIAYGADGGWVAGDFLDQGTDTQCQSGGSWQWQQGTCAQADIVTRSEWGARAPSCTLSTISNPTNYMFIHYSAGTACTTQASCTTVIQGIQDYHMDSNGWCDIGYSFLVGEDGRGYEGRGWRYVGAHTSGYNSVGHAICTMGDFMTRRPNDAAMLAVQHLIDCCLNQNYLVNSFKLNGHRDTEATSCPGDAYYVEIQTWPYYCFDAPSASNPGRTCTVRPLAKKAPLRLH